MNNDNFTTNISSINLLSESQGTHLQSTDVTLVTAFFDIGSFQKGKSQIYTPSRYSEWMAIFKYIENPLYVYVDKEEYGNIFRKIREEKFLNRTKIIVLNRKKLWSFGLIQNISAIFSEPKYPKFYPNTVLAEYSCAMHAKYEVLQKSITDNAFNTKYIAWADVGYYRDLLKKPPVHEFKVHLPPDFKSTKVSYNQVNSPMHRTLNQIIRNNEVWVGGGFFIADNNVMSKWVEDYMFYTERFIELGKISTDQQVLYAMAQPFIHKKIGKRRVGVQAYQGNDPSQWLYLGYLCIKAR